MVKVRDSLVRGEREKSTLDIRPKDMLISLLSSAVAATGVLENQLIFVRNLAPALGRTHGSPSQINEILASPVK